MEPKLILIYSVLCCALCYFIAQQKERHTGVWLLLGFFFGIFAVIIVAFIPKKSAQENQEDQLVKFTLGGSWFCPNCNQTNSPNVWECYNCHYHLALIKRLEGGKWQCPQCEIVNTLENQRCPNCQYPQVV